MTRTVTREDRVESDRRNRERNPALAEHLPEDCLIAFWRLEGAQHDREEDAGMICLPNGLTVDVGVYAQDEPRPFRIGVYDESWNALVEHETFSAPRVEFLAVELAEKYRQYPPAGEQASLEELREVEAWIRNRHNGYDPDCRATMNIQKPATLVAALEELEQEHQESEDQWAARLEEAKSIYFALNAKLNEIVRIAGAMRH